MAKILIAEDERDIRDLITFTLRFSGFDVVQAVDGADAVETTAEMPDPILMDVRMPRMTELRPASIWANRGHPGHTGGVPVGQGQDAGAHRPEAGASEYILAVRARPAGRARARAAGAGRQGRGLRSGGVAGAARRPARTNGECERGRERGRERMSAVHYRSRAVYITAR
jgi:CheY-like chemotaxis protein